MAESRQFSRFNPLIMAHIRHIVNSPKQTVALAAAEPYLRIFKNTLKEGNIMFNLVVGLAEAVLGTMMDCALLIVSLGTYKRKETPCDAESG